MREEGRTAAALLEFISKSPSCYHVAANMSDILEKAGFSRLFEEDTWSPGRESADFRSPPVTVIPPPSR